ncbi:helix-turn-helix transcriptional regulator [Streptomyces sp. 6N223]|uniref:helix-turn-helix transcriptional regulator n=1 Tax=Streptomyces sp. 6N223 TaxID=3457412 RepID=UPI003FD2CAD1
MRHDDGRELGGFLRSRRARVAPESVGLAAGARRRVRGLRREELAQLAGISVDYYVRLEQGRATQPSDEVLRALARVLGLGATEREHLWTLASARRGGPPSGRVSPLLRRMLDEMPGMPAFVTCHRLDVLAWNALGGALMGGLADPDARDRNQARFAFLDPASRRLMPDWEERAGEMAAMLRYASGRYPDDAYLAELVAELTTLSADFRRLWETGDVVRCTSGTKRFRLPAVGGSGEFALDYETLHVPAGPGQEGVQVHVYAAPEGSDAAAALRILAERAADVGAGVGGR